MTVPVRGSEGSKRDTVRTYSESVSKRLCEVKHSVKTKKERNNGPPTKVVVRRLPPTMTQDEFIEAVMPLPENDYFIFCAADTSLDPSNAFTRAYINFKNQGDILTFRDKFDGYVFVDQKGNEYPAMVEFAPFQKIPKRGGSKKKDARCGTIEQDPDYSAFVEAMHNPETVSLQPLEAMLEEIQAQDRDFKANNGYMKVKTPLLEYIEHRKAEKLRTKEEKREEKKRKELERKKAKEEEKRKKEIKEQRELKKKDDQKDDATNLKVLQHEREEGDGSSPRERKDRERQRRQEDYHHHHWEKEKEKGKFSRDKDREDRTKREEENVRMRDEDRNRHGDEKEERIKHREEGREDQWIPRYSGKDAKNRHRDEEKEYRMRWRDDGRRGQIRYKYGEKDERTRCSKDDERDYPTKAKDMDKDYQIRNKDRDYQLRQKERDDLVRQRDDNKDSVQHKKEEKEELITKRIEGKEEEEKLKYDGGIARSTKANRNEGTKSKRYSEGRKKEERERKLKEDRNKQNASVESDQQQQQPYQDKRKPMSGEEDDKIVLHKKREKDPRVERRIRNKDRPAMALYQPGQSRLSSRMKQDREEGADTSSSSPSPVMTEAKKVIPPTNECEDTASTCDVLAAADTEELGGGCIQDPGDNSNSVEN